MIKGFYLRRLWGTRPLSTSKFSASCIRLAIGIALLATIPVVASDPAAADFRVCNNTSNHLRLAIGYKSEGDWTTKGWWDLDPSKCESLITGTLAGRYYYVHAAEFDGEWSGKAFLCTGKGSFTIQGSDRCSVRGLDRTGFVEVDTQNQSEWTMQLNRAAAAPQ